MHELLLSMSKLSSKENDLIKEKEILLFQKYRVNLF
jgi:hypothetical protein